MRRLGAVLLLALPAVAQVEVRSDRLPAALRDFTPRPGETKLRCAVQPIRPALNFGFRFQAGWVMRVPLDQFRGKGHRWAMLARVAPQAGGNAVYLASAVSLPDVPRTKAVAEIGGGYLLGEGGYKVDYVMTDEQGRVCRRQWTVKASLHGAERSAKLAMAPGTVSGLAARRAKRLQPGPDDDVRRINLTVFLHAAPMSLRRTRIRAGDRLMLAGTLGALLEQVPARNVRLVVFNLEQQKVLLREDGFTAEGLDRVSRSLNELELGTVNYSVLRDPRGHVGLLAGMVNRELAESRPADVVVVLGPATRFDEKLPGAAVDRPAGKAPDFFYLQLQPYSTNPVFPDALKSTVSRLKGKAITIRSPADFARAIALVLQRAGVRD